MSERMRLDDAFHKLHTVLNHHDLKLMSGATAPYLETVERIVGGIEAGVAEWSALLTPPVARSLTAVERIVSLAGTLVAIAKARGAGLCLPDALQSLVVQHCPKGERAYWAMHSRDREIYGLIRSQPEVREACAAQGVLVWRNDASEHVRLIDTNWLTSHADIRAFVAGAWEGGRRCRFCRVVEPGDSLELQAVEPERRNAFTTINGTVQLQPGVVYTHEPCRPHWLRWLGIAEGYASAEAAEEADRAEGRERRALPAPLGEDAKPEKPSHGPRHVNRNEQGIRDDEPKVVRK